MLSGTPAVIAMVGTVLVVGILVVLFRRMVASADAQAEEEEAARQAYGQQLLDYVAQGHVNQPDAQGRTPLMLALEHQLTDVASQMLQYRPDLHARDGSGNSLLHYAAGSGSDDLVHAVAHAGVDPNMANVQGETALSMAAMVPNPRSVQLLLQYGADANHQESTHGHTPLMKAVLHMRVENVDALLDAAPDLSLRDHGDMTVVEMARREIPRHMGAYAEHNTVLMNMGMRLEAAESGTAYRPKEYGHPMDEWGAEGGPA